LPSPFFQNPAKQALFFVIDFIEFSLLFQADYEQTNILHHTYKSLFLASSCIIPAFLSHESFGGLHFQTLMVLVAVTRLSSFVT
jgi:hypothetical protein